MQISVLSWNILGPGTGDVQDYGFIQGDYGRLGKHLEIIHSYQADILCFQEVDLTTLHLFNSFLLGEYTQGAYHDKGAHGGVVVYVKKSKYELIDSVSALLPGNQERSAGAFAGAFIKDIQGESELFIASIHLNKSSKAEALSDAIKQISDLCNQIAKNLPIKVVIAGDYNTMYEDMKQSVLPVMSQVLGKEFLMFEHSACTSSSNSGELSSIDHVVYRGLKLDLENSCLVTSKHHHVHAKNLKKIYENGREYVVQPELPSDHVPVLAVFE